MLEGFVVLVLVGRVSVLTENEFGQVERETVGIFEREHIDTRDLRLTGLFSLSHQFVEQRDSLVERTQESLFLALDDRCDLRLLCLQFRISGTQVSDQLRHELIEERIAHVQERITVAYSATQDTTDDITRFLVRRQLTVCDSERDRTDMIGDHTHRDIDLLILTVLTTADSTDLAQHRLEDIRIVVRGLTLDRTHETLKAHTGVDHFLRKRFERTVGFAVILHKDDIPDLNHLRVVFVDQFTTGHFGAFLGRTAVHVDLTTRTARTRIAHFPEVVVLVTVQDMICRQMLCPDRSRLIVTRQTFLGRTLKDGCVQVSGVDLQYIHDILPCKINRLFLEIVAKRPVTQHLKHRVVVGIMTYFLQVVMLTRNAQTLLTVRHTRVLDRIIAQDDSFPRVHTGVGEHQRRIIFNHHRRRRNNLVTFRCHKVQKGLSNLL